MDLRAIVLHPQDNVATALVDIEAGEGVIASQHHVTAIERIPFGHKIALRSIARGGQVTKYGEPIGCAAHDIAEGAMVHVHNLESQRGRGDLNDARIK
jgi:altronate dehydratase small subunit